MLKKTEFTIINVILMLLVVLSASTWLIRELVGCGYQWPSLALWMASNENLVSSLFTAFLLIIIILTVYLIIRMPKPNIIAAISLFFAVFFAVGIVATNEQLTGFRGCFDESRMQADIAKIAVLQRNHLSNFGEFASSIDDLNSRELLSKPWSYFIEFRGVDKQNLDYATIGARFNNEVIFQCNGTLSQCDSFLR